MKQHTIGPWLVNHEGTTDEGDHLRHDFSVQTPLCDHDNEVGLATAKLIAAAPDMLWALENIFFQAHDDDSSEDDLRSLIDSMRSYADTAIKKAK
jgi:hypothetical protein